jgi:hypothetical protein
MTSSLLPALAVFVVIPLVMILGARYHARQMARMKRGKEILDRFNPERSKHPLGL